MTWSPSTPPTTHLIIIQTENDNVFPAIYDPGLETLVVYNTKTPVHAKFWQDFPKPLQPRDRFGAKKPYRL